MKKIIVFLFILIIFLIPTNVSAQQPATQQFYKAEVVAVVREGTRTIGGTQNQFQELKVKLLDGYCENEPDASCESPHNFFSE